MLPIEPPTISLLKGDAAAITPRVWRGTLFSRHGQRPAYIKVLPARKLLIECVAAVVGRAHDLPIPPPHLVMFEGHQLPGFDAPEFSGWAFGSEDTDVPSLSRITHDRDQIELRIRGWGRASEAAAFDSWIGNEDRTTKNLLWSDDASKIGLIDHDDAFPEWLNFDADSANEIMRILCDGSDDFSRRRHHRAAIKSTKNYAKTDWTDRTAWVTNFVDESHVDALIAFLSERLQHLPALLAAAAGTRQIEMQYAP